MVRTFLFQINNRLISFIIIFSVGTTFNEIYAKTHFVRGFEVIHFLKKPTFLCKIEREIFYYSGILTITLVVYEINRKKLR